MKLFKLHILLAGLLLLVGCSQDEDFGRMEENVQGQRVYIRVGMPDDQQSRVSYNPDESLPAFTWESNDQICLIGYDAAGTYKGQSLFTLQEGLSQKSGVFMGYLVDGAIQYHICYMSKQLRISEEEGSKGQTYIDYSNQTQDGDNSVAHIKDYLLLKTSEMLPAEDFIDRALDKDDMVPAPEKDEAETNPEAGNTPGEPGTNPEAGNTPGGETNPEGGNTPGGETTPKKVVKLKMQNSIMKFNVKFGVDDINKEIASLRSISWITNVGVPESTKTLQLNLALTLTDMTEATAYLCFDPSDMALIAGNYMHVVFHGTKDYIASGKSTNGITYAKGKRYYINIDNTIEPQSDALRWVPQQVANEIWMRTEGDVRVEMVGYTSTTKDVDGIKYQVLEKTGTITELPPFYKDGKITLTNGDKVTEIILPRDITTIQENAFRDFSKLEIIHIPNSLTTIGEHVFEGCTSLREFKEATPGTHVKNQGKVLVVGNDIIRCVPTINEKLDLSDFTNNTIRPAAFKDCPTLPEIILPSGITGIPESAFQNCVTLTKATFEGKITSVGINAFKNCPLLKTVDLSAVTAFGAGAFEGCKELAEITNLGAVLTIGANAFKGCEKLAGTLNISTLTQTSIEAGTFYGCSKLTEVTLPGGITDIKGETDGNKEANGAFQNCSKLTTVNLSNVQKFGPSAFEDCSLLKNITSIDQAQQIGKNAFKGTAITTLVIPSSVTEIGANAFSNCNNLSQVKLLAPYSENIDMSLFADITNPKLDIYLNKDWLTDKVPEDKRPSNNTWGGHEWKNCYVSNADGTTGIEKLPGYDEIL